jgi:hypothetical protein
VASDRAGARWLFLLAGLMFGGMLTYLICLATMKSSVAVARLDSVSDRSVDRPVAQPSPVASCPPAPRDPATKCEPTIVTVRQGTDPADERLESMQPRRVQTALVEAMQVADIGASFELDCTGYPCFAVFAGEAPSAEDRSSILSDLVDALPDAELISSTRIGDDLQVTWVVVVAESGLTDADEAAVKARIDGMLLP